MGRKTSIVWNHFKISTSDSTKAICNYCAFPVGRGQKNQGTTALMNHLKRCKELRVRLSSAQPPGQISGDPGEENPGDLDASDFCEMNSETNSSSFLSPSSLQDQPFIQEYQNNGKPSVLLYGDITSTNTYEEPSSSVNPDSDLKKESPDIPTNSADVSINSCDPLKLLEDYNTSETTVDFMHGGIVLHRLYAQYKAGQFCDLKLVTHDEHKGHGVISSTGKITRRAPAEVKNELKVHSCLLAAMSKKIAVMVGMGCSTIQLKKGRYEALQRLMEIAYTGKIEAISTLSLSEVREILDIARYLEVEIVEKYLRKQRPDLEKPRLRQNVTSENPKVMSEVMTAQARKHQKTLRTKSLSSLFRGTVSKYNLNRGRRNFVRRYPRPFSNSSFLSEKSAPPGDKEQLRSSRRSERLIKNKIDTNEVSSPEHPQLQGSGTEEEGHSLDDLQEDMDQTELSQVKVENLDENPT